jgi:hypothetical protein
LRAGSIIALGIAQHVCSAYKRLHGVNSRCE